MDQSMNELMGDLKNQSVIKAPVWLCFLHVPFSQQDTLLQGKTAFNRCRDFKSESYWDMKNMLLLFLNHHLYLIIMHLYLNLCHSVIAIKNGLISQMALQWEIGNSCPCHQCGLQAGPASVILLLALYWPVVFTSTAITWFPYRLVHTLITFLLYSYFRTLITQAVS